MKIKTLMLVILSNFFITGGYAAGNYVDFRTAVLGHDPAKVVPDTNVRITALTHDQEYPGFQPLMASHYSRFDFNNDGILTVEECQEGMKL